jgi:hypothetical protein
MTDTKIVEPFVRLAAALGGIVSSLALADLPRLLLLWAVILIGPAFVAHVVRTHLLFLAAVCAPIFVSSSVIHAASHGKFLSLAIPNESFEPGALVTIRIATIGLITQVFFIPLFGGSLLARVLRYYGLRGQALMIIAGSIALIEDIRSRFGRITDSYNARGLMPKSRLGHALRTGEYLRPLFVSVLATAVTRSEAWQNRGMLQRFERWHDDPILIDYPRTILLVLWAGAGFAVILSPLPGSMNVLASIAQP